MGIRQFGWEGWVNREKYSSVARPGACNEALNDGIPSREARDSGVLLLCARGDLNPHARRHRNLNPACLPISPLARGAVADCLAAVHAKGTKRSTADASLQCTFRDVPSARCLRNSSGPADQSSPRSRRSLAT
jgi:hypothetical protein